MRRLRNVWCGRGNVGEREMDDEDNEDVYDSAIVVVLAILFGSPCVVA